MADQQKRRLTVSDIAIGEPLAWDIYGEDRKLLLRRGQIVQSEHQIEALIQRGLYVDDQGGEQGGKADAQKVRQETASALRFINLATKRLERLLYNIGNETDVQAKIQEVAKALVYATDINADIAIGSILLNQSAANYAIRHSVDTALLSLQVARALNKSAEEIQLIMAAALTMNIAMLRQQDLWQNRQEPLTEKDSQLIRNHVQEGVNMLRQAGITDPAWLSYVELHHESGAGTGYPNGKPSQDVPQNAKILAFADRYCASVVSRKYRKPLLPGTALRDVLCAGGQPTDPLLAAYFIKELGTYPPGTFVRLQNGEIGVVTRKGKSPTTPVVHALIGPRGAPLSFPIQRDTTKELFAIREALSAEQAAVRFSMQQLWGDEAAP
jgi:HD-GYP domain-containing protein (c-di-GMP phosphodiesterase class II)